MVILSGFIFSYGHRFMIYGQTYQGKGLKKGRKEIPKTQGECKCIYTQKYMYISQNKSFIVELLPPCTILHLIFLFFSYTSFHLPLLVFSVLTNTKQQKNCSSHINTKAYHNFFSHIVEGGNPGPIEILIFLGGYWLSYANLHFLLLVSSVLVSTKQN